MQIFHKSQFSISVVNRSFGKQVPNTIDTYLISIYSYSINEKETFKIIITLYLSNLIWIHNIAPVLQITDWQDILRNQLYHGEIKTYFRFCYQVNNQKDIWKIVHLVSLVNFRHSVSIPFHNKITELQQYNQLFHCQL